MTEFISALAGPARRAQGWQRLRRSDCFDLAVVGGGATGLGVALDAALRGYSVLLLESHDFASGTSSRSTKLLHGGVRYLAQGQLALVRQALAERSIVLRLAPHLAQPLAFVMPSYGWWQTPFYGLGLMFYDLLAGRAGLGRTAMLSRQQTLAALPGLQERGLRGGVRYWDAQFDDARLALALARTAEAAGACVLNHAEVTALHRLPGDGAPLFALEVEDRVGAQSCRVQARCVVNATGVWVDRLRAQASAGAALAPAQRLVSPSQGVHVVVERNFLPGNQALLVPRTRDGRVLFALPWLGKIVLGTTDTPRQDLPREPTAFAGEIDFILTEAARVLRRPLQRSDVQSVWVGLRPLVAPEQAGSGRTAALLREHRIVVDESGLVTATGGKWTSYRAMAEDVLQHCVASGQLPARRPCVSAEHRLLGAPASAAPATPLHAPPGLHLYGSAAAQVLACPGHDQHLGLGLTEAMVRYAVRAEYAQTVQDVLARRWRALFLDARASAAMAPAVAALLEQEQVADPGLDDFLALCAQCLPGA